MSYEQWASAITNIHCLPTSDPGPKAASVPQTGVNDTERSMVGAVEYADTPAYHTPLSPGRIVEIMRLQDENASLRAELADERAKRQAVESDNAHIRDMITRQSAHHADLVAKYAALFSLHIKQPTVIPDAAPEFPVRALTHQRQPIGLLTGRGE